MLCKIKERLQSLTVPCLCVLFFVVIFARAVFYEDITPVDTISSPDGKYTVELQQVGSPGWPFGPVDAKILLKKDGKTIEKHKTFVHTDGAQLSEFYWDVEWFEDKVVITLSGEDGGRVVTLDLT